MSASESAKKPFVPTHTQRSESIDKDEQRKEMEKKLKNLRMDFAICFSTPEGKSVLRWLCAQCGYHKSQVGGNPPLGMDILTGTLYNAAREGIYIEMRSLIPWSILQEVEYQKLEEII